MSENFRRYNPNEDQGEIIDIIPIVIKPRISGRMTESAITGSESESNTFDQLQQSESLNPFSLEGLKQIKTKVATWFRQANDHRMALIESGEATEDFEEFYQSIRNHVSVINDLIREMQDLTSSENDHFVEQRAEVFAKNLSLLEEMVEVFLSGEGFSVEAEDKAFVRNDEKIPLLSSDLKNEDVVSDIAENLSKKEDFERPSDLTSEQRDELQRLFVAVEKTPLSIGGTVNYEKSADIQQEYDKLLELIEEFQGEVTRILSVGVAYSRDWRALGEIQEDIADIKDLIEKSLSPDESDDEVTTEDAPEDVPAGVRKLTVLPKKHKIKRFDGREEQVSNTERRVFPGGSYPEQHDPKEIKMEGDLLDSLERENREILEDYRGKVEKIRVALDERIIPNLKEEALSKDEKSNLRFLYQEFENLYELLSEVEQSVKEGKEIPEDTKESFTAYYKQLQKGVDYYENLIADGSPIFKKEAEEIPTVDSSEILAPVKEVSPEYAVLRKEWLEAKALHKEKQEEYLKAVDEFYKNWTEEINSKGFWGRSIGTLRAKFGVRPDLPQEILDLKDASQDASHVYNEKAREMSEKRSLAGKRSLEGVSQKVLDRYYTRLGAEVLVNTTSAQGKMQKEAVEALGVKPEGVLSTLLKHKNKVKFVGAMAIGAATGGAAGVVAGGAWWLRSTTGGLAGGAVAGIYDKKLRDSITAWELDQIESEAQNLAEKLKTGALSKEEFKEWFAKFENILAQVDERNRSRIMKVLFAAGAAGMLVGGVAGTLEDAVFSGGGEGDVVGTGTEGKVGAGAVDAKADSTIAADAGNAEGNTAAAQSAVANPETAPYVAEKGDNFWDVMEGETKAGEPSFAEKIDPAREQAVIDLVRDKINTDATLRAELGFGETADDLAVGAEIDTNKLNQLAEEIAKEKGWLKAEGATEVGASETPEASVEKEVVATEDVTSQRDSTPPETSSDSTSASVEKPDKTSETLFMKSVAPEKNIEYARAYQGGYMKFEADFQKLFVEKIQGPAPADSLFGRIFGGAPNSTDAFKIFAPYTVAEFNQLEKVDAATLAKALGDEQIDMKDYLAWRDSLKQWQEAGMVINPKDRFSDVAEAAFINSLNQPKAS